jgi:1-deoxy-D-xylulose-5-phosphate synthase
MRFVKPLDNDLIASLVASHELLVTVEENTIMGGAGSAVMESLESAGLKIPVLQLGLPDTFIDQGDPSQMLADCGLDGTSISRSVRARFMRS